MWQEMHCLIIEDDHSYGLELKLLLIVLGIENITLASTYESAVVKILEQRPQLVLCDVKLNDHKSGIDLALMFEDYQINFIMLTSFPEEQDFKKIRDKDHCVYFTKPISKFSLASLIETLTRKVLNENMPSKSALLIKKLGNYFKIPFEEINYIEAQKDHCLIITNDQKFVNKISLTKTLSLLPSQDFMRVHRSFIINLKKIQSFQGVTNQILIGKEKIPLSRSCKANFLNAYTLID